MVWCVCVLLTYCCCSRRRRRQLRRRRIIQQDADSGSGTDRSDDSSNGNHATCTDLSPQQLSEHAGGRGRRSGRRRGVEFAGSVYVGSLPHHVRVSEFKAEVRDRNVNPLRVLWRGNNGFAFLNFRTRDEAELALEALHGLQVSVTPVTSCTQRVQTVPRCCGVAIWLVTMYHIQCLSPNVKESEQEVKVI